MKAAKPTCSIIICSKGRPQSLLACLQSLNSQSNRDFESIVVCPREDFAHVKGLDGGVVKNATWLLQENSGLPQARNLGINESSGEIILFLDDDVVLTDNYVDNLIRFLSNNADVGGVGGIYQRGRHDVYCYSARWPLEKLFLRTWIGENAPIGIVHHNGFTSTNFEYLESRQDVQILNGCNMAFRRDVVQAAEGFDPNYVGNGLFEDADFSYRVWKNGVRLVATPHLRLFHRGKPHIEYPHCPSYVYDFASNGVYFYFKNVHPDGAGRFLLFFTSRLYFALMMIGIAALRRDIHYFTSCCRGLRDGLKRARWFLA